MVDRDMITFVGGFRSGSTLLINLLGLHPGISVWYETKCLCEPLRWLKVLNGSSGVEFEADLAVPREIVGFTAEAIAQRMRRDVEDTAARVAGSKHSGKAGHECYPIGADHVGYTIEEALACLEEWRQGVQGQAYGDIAYATGRLVNRLAALHKAGWQNLALVNKTPEMPRFGAELRSCLGSCRIVNLIRDGREVAASAAGLQWGDVYRMGELWEELIRQSRLAAKTAPDSYLEIRYENLVAHPAATVDQVLQFIGLEPLGEELVCKYQECTGVRVAAESRACDPETRASLEHLPIKACELLEELGYVGSGSGEILSSHD